MQTRICRFHMCKYGLQIKTWSFCMCICVSAQQNRVFWRKKSANSHFSAKKDGAKPDTVFCKRHRSKKITALGCEFVSPSAKAADTQKKRRHHFFQMVSSEFFFGSILILLLHTSDTQMRTHFSSRPNFSCEVCRYSGLHDKKGCRSPGTKKRM